MNPIDMPNSTSDAHTRHTLNQRTKALTLTACPRSLTSSSCSLTTSTNPIPLGLPRAEPRDCPRSESGGQNRQRSWRGWGAWGEGARFALTPRLLRSGCARGNTQRPGTSGPFPRLPVRRGCPTQRPMATLLTSLGQGGVSHLASVSVEPMEATPRTWAA